MVSPEPSKLYSECAEAPADDGPALRVSLLRNLARGFHTLSLRFQVKNRGHSSYRRCLIPGYMLLALNHSVNCICGSLNAPGSSSTSRKNTVSCPSVCTLRRYTCGSLSTISNARILHAAQKRTRTGRLELLSLVISTGFFNCFHGDPVTAFADILEIVLDPRHETHAALHS